MHLHNIFTHIRSVFSDTIRSILGQVKKQPVRHISFLVAILFGIVGVQTFQRAAPGAPLSSIVSKPISITPTNFTTLAGGAWAVNGTSLKLTNPAKPAVDSIGNANYAIANVPVKGDFTESVDFTVLDSSSAWDDASVIFDWTDVNNYYFASFNSSANDTTNGIFKISGGVQTRLVAFNSTFAAGVSRHATITRDGSNISVNIGSLAVGNATDPLLPATGLMGVGSRNDTVAFSNFLVTIPADVTAPSIPTGLQSSGVTTTTTDITWGASTDAEGVTGYKVYRNDVQVGTTTTALTFANTGLTPGASYTYTVAAFDAAGNVSAKSPILTVATPAFVHPGVLLNKTQLDFVKDKLYNANGTATGAQPWSAGLVQAQTRAKADQGKNSGMLFSSLSWTPHPVAYVLCAAKDGSRPDQGCGDEITDAQAAYTDTLLWYYTGNAAYAEKAVQILNAWSGTLIDHKLDGNVVHEGVLESAWGGELFPKSAEILRYLYTPAPGKPTLNVANMSKMLRTAYLPHVIDGWYGAGGNWLMSMADATMSIGVFLDDQAVFQNGAGDWRDNVPAIIYMKGDVNKWPQLAGLPISAPNTMYDKSNMSAATFKSYWHNPTSYVSGLNVETCRDMNHMAMGMGAMINGAETARIQGVDLYGEQKDRIVKGMEYNTGLLTSAVLNGKNPPAGAVCGKALDVTDGAWRVTWEIGYNEYALRLGIPMPNTSSFLTNKVRPSTYRTSMSMDYETLTHYGTP